MQEPLPVDAALPALASARYEALAAALARVGLQGARAISVLRYNPGKRCTLAVASDTDRYIVKLFADAATVLAVSTVHKVLAGAGLASGRGPTVPRLVGLDTDAALIVTEMYAAVPATELVERGDADRAGRLAAQWLRAAIKPGVALGDPYDPPHVLEDVQRYVRTIGRAAGELGGRAGAVRDQLAADIPPPGCTDLRHGGFYLSHVFDLVDGPGVIDWDTFRQGPVEVDAGMLCAAARTSAGGLGVPGSARVGLRRSGERGKQITQVRLVRGTAQHGTDLEDLFHRPQRRAVVIVDCVLVADLGVRREDQHGDRPVLRVTGRGAAFSLVPGDEQHATLL